MPIRLINIRRRRRKGETVDSPKIARIAYSLTVKVWYRIRIGLVAEAAAWANTSFAINAVNLFARTLSATARATAARRHGKAR